MAEEQQTENVEIQQRAPQPVVSIRAVVPIQDLGAAQGEFLSAIVDYLRSRGTQPAGPPFVRYHTFGGDETDLELGVPVAEAIAGADRVVGSELPGGPAVATWHIGSHERLGEAYGRLHGWMQAHGHAPSGPGWEVYCWIDPRDDPDPAAWPDAADWRTQLIQPIHET